MGTSTSPPRSQHVRPATQRDIPVCAVLFKEWAESAASQAQGQQLDPTYDYAGDLASRLNRENEVMFVAEDDGEIHGFIVIRAGTHRKNDLIDRVGRIVRKMLRRTVSGSYGNSHTATLEQVVVKPGSRNNYMSLALLRTS